MKRILFYLGTSMAILCIVVTACKKNSTTVSTDTSHLNQLFAGLKTTPQTLSVTAGRDTIVYGSGGTMLHFYTNSFKNASGTIITSGTINIQLVEMYKPGDMALNRATTTANDSLLKSGGQIKVLAFQGPDQVFANKYGLGFPQPGASTQSMQLFFGGTPNPDSTVTWSIADTTKPGTTASGTTTDSGSVAHPTVSFMYIFDSCTNFEWINCDHFMGGGYTLTQVIVQLPDATYNSSNTQVYIIFPTDKSVAGLSYISSKKAFASGPHSMPVGLAYEIVVTTNKNGSYYYWEGSGTVTADMTVSAAMASETLQDIIVRMHAL